VVDLKALIRDVPDFPQPGILFRDITPLLGNAEALSAVLDALEGDARVHGAEAIVGIESRGFIFGVPLADRMKLPFVPVRKPGKLPAARMSVEYSLEYGESQLDIHADALAPGARAYIVDDLLATGGTARAACKLVELAGGKVAGVGFAVELGQLEGRTRLTEYPVFSLVLYQR
jgi:adenine phosphoribosyltransferase